MNCHMGSCDLDGAGQPVAADKVLTVTPACWAVEAETESSPVSFSGLRTPAPAPHGMVLAGPVYRLQISGTNLTGRVRLTVPVPVPVPNASCRVAGPAAALLAFYVLGEKGGPLGRWPTLHGLRPGRDAGERA